MANRVVVPEQDSVVVEIEIAAPPDRVFQALTDAKQLEQWWRSPICETTAWKMDPRPAGKWGFETSPASQSINGVNEYKCHGEILDYMPGRYLVYTWIANWRDGHAANNIDPVAVQHWNRPKLWDYLVSEKLLRVMVVVAGVGPHAAGMPELDLSFSSPAALSSIAILVTDGRVSFGNIGISIGHLVPEALDGGALGSVRTGDWIYMDLAHGELQVVRELKRHKGFRPLSPKDLMNRPDRRKRMHELQRQRMDILPSIRLLLDHVSSADAGVSPLNKLS